jgi:hypothetical protein
MQSDHRGFGGSRLYALNERLAFGFEAGELFPDLRMSPMPSAIASTNLPIDRVTSPRRRSDIARSRCAAAPRAQCSTVVDAGQAAAWYQDRVFQSLACKRLQIDEIWGFVGAKAKNASPEAKEAGTAGDAWRWLATDAETAFGKSLIW